MEDTTVVEYKVFKLLRPSTSKVFFLRDRMKNAEDLTWRFKLQFELLNSSVKLLLADTHIPQQLQLTKGRKVGKRKMWYTARMER